VYFLLDGEVSLSRGGMPTGLQGTDLLGAGALLGESAEHDAVTTVPSLLLKWETKDLARRLDEAGGLSDLARSRSVRALAEEPFRQSALRPLPEQALEAIFQIGRIETHRKGSVLIREGDVDRDVWVLLDGAVRITNQARTIDA